MVTKPKKKTKACKVTIRELKKDPPWRRLAKAYKQLLPHSKKYAAKDLMEALKSGRLRCVRRIETDPKYAEEVSITFWRSLPWPGKLYFDRLDTYDPEFYVEQPWEVLPVPQAAGGTKASKPERKRAKGGGAKSKYTDEQKEFGRGLYHRVRKDPKWRSASQEAVAKRVQDLAEQAGHPLGGHWKTAYRAFGARR
jgi:hypothetical protein